MSPSLPHSVLLEAHSAKSLVFFDFAYGSSAESWQPVDDGVMGGVSRSEFQLGGRFSGFVSLENNGGFCSVRSPAIGLGLGEFNAIRLRLRGDGKTYCVCLHTRYQLPGTSYRARFDTTEGLWDEITIPFSDFVLMRYGFRAGILPVEPRQILAFSLMISDKQEGPFQLDVAEICAVRV